MSLVKTWEWNETNRYRNYFITCNNYTENQYQLVLQATDVDRKPKCKYVAISKEVGATNGVPHFHALLYFKDAHQVKVIRNKFRDMHIEPTKPKSTFKQQWEYITKTREGDPGRDDPSLASPVEESGERPQDTPWKAGNEANKEAWERTRALARENRLDEIDACHYITQYNNLKRIAKDNQPKPDPLPIPARKVYFEWWYGPPGAGKSMAAMKKLQEEFGEDNVYDKPPQVKWVGEDCKPTDAWRINDLDQYQSKHLGGLLKTWAEESPFQAEFKGGLQWLRPAKIIVTSNPPPWEIWTDAHTIDAILSRFKIVYWPTVYHPTMARPDPRVDEIHPPWTYTPPVLTVPPPVLSRTASSSLAIVGSNWLTELRQPIPDQQNRDEITEWLRTFNDFEARPINYNPISSVPGFTRPATPPPQDIPDSVIGEDYY